MASVVVVWFAWRWSGVASTALTTASAARSRREMRDDGLAWGGGAVWHHGGVNCLLDEGFCCFNLHPRDGLAEDDGGDFQRVCMRLYL